MSFPTHSICLVSLLSFTFPLRAVFQKRIAPFSFPGKRVPCLMRISWSFLQRMRLINVIKLNHRNSSSLIWWLGIVNKIVWMITLTARRMIYKAVHKLRSISAAGCVSVDWNMRLSGLRFFVLTSFGPSAWPGTRPLSLSPIWLASLFTHSARFLHFNEKNLFTIQPGRKIANRQRTFLMGELCDFRWPETKANRLINDPHHGFRECCEWIC